MYSQRWEAKTVLGWLMCLGGWFFQLNHFSWSTGVPQNQTDFVHFLSLKTQKQMIQLEVYLFDSFALNLVANCWRCQTGNSKLSRQKIEFKHSIKSAVLESFDNDLNKHANEKYVTFVHVTSKRSMWKCTPCIMHVNTSNLSSVSLNSYIMQFLLNMLVLTEWRNWRVKRAITCDFGTYCGDGRQRLRRTRSPLLHERNQLVFSLGHYGSFCETPVEWRETPFEWRSATDRWWHIFICRWWHRPEISCARMAFLAHQIRISEISYLNHVILNRLSHEGFTLFVLELTRQSRHVTSLVC